VGGRLRACYGRDPEGNVVELMQILTPAYAAPLLV